MCGCAKPSVCPVHSYSYRFPLGSIEMRWVRLEKYMSVRYSPDCFIDFFFFWFDLIGTSIFIVRAERDAYKYNTVVKIRLRSLWIFSYYFFYLRIYILLYTYLRTERYLYLLAAVSVWHSFYGGFFLTYKERLYITSSHISATDCARCSCLCGNFMIESFINLLFTIYQFPKWKSAHLSSSCESYGF